MTWLGRVASAALVPVHAAIGPRCLAAVERLLAGSSMMRTTSPRHAAVLLVAGDIPDTHTAALCRLHDQVPPPRATVYWNGAAGGAERELRARWRAICLRFDGEGEADCAADEPPNAWRGKGDHGQGGEGMMGGVPYGRPMAMTGEDIRDGLRLDRYSARVGPFAPTLPPGLVLGLTLQGDVIVACDVLALPFVQAREADAPAYCAARMLRLMGLEGAADGLIVGNRLRAFGVGHALPGGLGRLENQGDARVRLATWLGGGVTGGDARGIFRSLVGLEWSEAMLVLASVTPSALHRAAAEAQVA